MFSHFTVEARGKFKIAPCLTRLEGSCSLCVPNYLSTKLAKPSYINLLWRERSTARSPPFWCLYRISPWLQIQPLRWLHNSAMLAYTCTGWRAGSLALCSWGCCSLPGVLDVLSCASLAVHMASVSGSGTSGPFAAWVIGARCWWSHLKRQPPTFCDIGVKRMMLGDHCSWPLLTTWLRCHSDILSYTEFGALCLDIDHRNTSVWPSRGWRVLELPPGYRPLVWEYCMPLGVCVLGVFP